MKFCFGDIVVVDDIQIGVVVKCWQNYYDPDCAPDYDVYVRSYNDIRNYEESKIQRYMVRHKYLNDEEVEYQRDAVYGYGE